MKPAPETTLSAMIAAETPDPALSSRLAAAASAFARRKVEVRALAIHYDWSIAAVSSDT